MRYEKQFMETMTERLEEYEKVFKAKEFIKMDGCPFCRIYWHCEICPLSTLNPEPGEDWSGCVTTSKIDMLHYLDSPDMSLADYKKAAKTRYKELIKFLDKLGYEYK